GKSYQLWAIGNQGPVSAGVFAPDIAGSAVITIFMVKETESVLQFAVTIEPKGGVPQPTGSMVLAGKPI
ncbi:MAG TPA: anti-sigma factor, partial [Acidobacteriota bacterium]|nr:anti-sigma factor [Acidobacteriota bacterium]